MNRTHSKTLPLRVALPLLALIAASGAQAACDTRWYQGSWQCTVGNSPMTLNFRYDNSGDECVIHVESSIASGPVVRMALIGADQNSVTFEDEAHNVFNLRRDPAAGTTVRGEARIDGIADPLSCDNKPLRSQAWRLHKLRTRQGNSP